ncbi:hypothetical protein PG993_007748 [Apiospora rasikravindrae]|uniref:APCDD1 domain-containing protein n=1 Tax=Apiospora rasikravindrae TaxID=990691 RepID=A0ABR1SYR6_9PEZI
MESPNQMDTGCGPMSTTSQCDDRNHGRWSGQLPCVCYSHQGCDQHNPARKLIYRNPSLFPKQPERQKRERPGFFGALWANLLFFNAFIRRVEWHKSQHAGPIKNPEDVIRPAREDVLSDTRAAENEFEPLPVLPFARDNPPFSSNLPFDTGSITTLRPIHKAIPYHLAFYHLDYARRLYKLNSNSKACFIAELSCHGTSTIDLNVPCTWSSEIYYNGGTFLQKQELAYTINSRRTIWPPVKIRVCHHRSVQLQYFRAVDNHGLLAVSLFITFLPKGRWRGDTGGPWSSAWGGNLRNLHVCDRCHSDLEYHVEVVGSEAHVRFTCSRDLGAATDRFLPKWHILQTAAGSYCFRNRQYHYDIFEGRCDDPSTYDVYKRVWRTAKKLGRPNLYLTTFRTSQETSRRFRTKSFASLCCIIYSATTFCRTWDLKRGRTLAKKRFGMLHITTGDWKGGGTIGAMNSVCFEKLNFSCRSNYFINIIPTRVRSGMGIML